MLDRSRRCAAVTLLAAAGCASEPSSLERSCAGDPVLGCPPSGYAEVERASVGPQEVSLSDPEAELNFDIVLRDCDDPPSPHRVTVRALTAGEDGEAGRVVSLFELNDDGRFGDETAGDGRITKAVRGPFIGTRELLPAGRELTLLLQPQLNTACRGPVFEVPYRTGSM